MDAVQSPIIPIIGELVRSHPGTISLGQGVVSYGPPREALDAIARFGSDVLDHRYKPVEGIPELIGLIERKLAAENGIAVRSSSRVVVSAGGNMAFMNAVLAIADPGDEIILQTPYYFNHEMAVTMASCRAVLVPTDENYQLRPAAIRAAITPRTRAVVTVSPNNPTGAVYSEAALRDVNALCREAGIFHISDEAYENFVYGNARHFSPGSIDGAGDHTISLYSLSKAYGFASWRVGYAVIPEALFDAVKKIQDTILICPPVISQRAAAGALQVGSVYCARHREALADVRGIVLTALRELGERCVIPPADGAFYFFLKVNTPREPLELVERLVREHGVAAIPGTAFGMNGGCYLRVAYGALEKQTVAEGIGRLVRGIKALT